MLITIGLKWTRIEYFAIVPRTSRLIVDREL